MPYVWYDDQYEGSCNCNHKEKHVLRGWSCGMLQCEDGYHTVPDDYSTPCPYYPETKAEYDKAFRESKDPLTVATRKFLEDNKEGLLKSIFT